AYFEAVERGLFTISEAGRAKLGIGLTSTINRVNLTTLAPAGGRALGHIERRMRGIRRLGPRASRLIGGAVTLLGSTKTLGAELFLFSSDAGYGSDCPGCLIHEMPGR